jgi:uncharacterized protein YggU (UPF0235/DUF167 family)
VQWEGETLHIWVSQRAVEGAANRAVMEAVARMFGVGSSSVTIAAGRRGRNKVLVVEGVPRRALPDSPA